VIDEGMREFQRELDMLFPDGAHVTAVGPDRDFHDSECANWTTPRLKVIGRTKGRIVVLATWPDIESGAWIEVEKWEDFPQPLVTSKVATDPYGIRYWITDNVPPAAANEARFAREHDVHHLYGDEDLSWMLAQQEEST
jgi:hypothetical protein